jgi:hypothetical protein
MIVFKNRIEFKEFILHSFILYNINKLEWLDYIRANKN